MPVRSLRLFLVLLSALLLGSFALVPLDAQRRPKPPKEQPEEGDPEVAQSAIAEGEQALSRGNYKSAKTAFKKAVKEAPADQQAARGLAEACFQSGDPELAITTLNKCIENATGAE